ncbi:MAG: transcriptional regulator, Fis family [Burkholderiaceae bacterium]|nr:transcriptional regulator, Fis family [Burkholderiaceae bacterium]
MHNNTQVWRELLPLLSQMLLSLRDVTDILRVLSNSAGPVIGFAQVNLVLPDPQTRDPRLHYLSHNIKSELRLDTQQFGNIPAAQIFTNQNMLQCSGISFRRDYPKSANLPPYTKLEAYCLLPLKTKCRFLGGIEFIKRHGEIFDGNELLQMCQLAEIVAAALENLTEHVAHQITEEQTRLEREQYRVLVEITNAALSKLNIDELVDEISDSIHNYFGFDYVSLDTCDLSTHRLYTHSIHFQKDGSRMRQSVMMSIYASLSGQVMMSKEKALLNRQEVEQLANQYSQVALLANQGFQMIFALPLISGDKARGALKLGHHRPYTFTPEKLELIEQIAARLAIVLDNALAYEEISALKEKLASENSYLTEEIRNYADFDEIIGISLPMQNVLQQVELVASSDATVLILGETGTGKELIARAIHRLSKRSEKTMVKMNCAAVPAGLLESDLFGHEKGAFTGAQTRRHGRFELAHQSTLFLDEVGDLPLELQPKLLRVLQECEIERLGGTRVIPVDVRVIAATNSDLRQKVADHQYRSDLYYRLNVFPIVIPPLRERPEDIPQLVNFFVKKFAQRMNKHIDSIPSETIARLIQMPWPGNVRELENVIERAVILTRSNVLELPLNEIQYQPAQPDQPPKEPPKRTESIMHDLPRTTRDAIVRVLRETHGILYGPTGAAARLGLKRTTLISRMQRLGISAKDFREDDCAEA